MVSMANGTDTTTSNVTTGVGPSASPFTGAASVPYGSDALMGAFVAALTAFLV